MIIPQGIAYAHGISNLPPQYGLYASYLGMLVYAEFGTCKDISVGPASILSLLVASFSQSVNGVTVVGDALFLAFFGGMIQFFMGLFHLGVYCISTCCD